jgi:hypothetical protein
MLLRRTARQSPKVKQSRRAEPRDSQPVLDMLDPSNFSLMQQVRFARVRQESGPRILSIDAEVSPFERTVKLPSPKNLV